MIPQLALAALVMAVLALFPSNIGLNGNGLEAGRREGRASFASAVALPLEQIDAAEVLPLDQLSAIGEEDQEGVVVETIGDDDLREETRSGEEPSDDDLELAELDARRVIFAAMSPPLFRAGRVSEVSLVQMLETARKLLGVSYVWGGASTSGMDCSAYLSAVWRVPGRTTETLPSVAFQISKDQLRAGDALNLTAQQDTQGYGHVRLFSAWADAEHTRMWVYEQTPPRATFHEIAYDGRYTPMRRMGFVADDVAPLAPARGTPGAFIPSAGERGLYFDPRADTPEFRAKHGPPSRTPPLELVPMREVTEDRELPRAIALDVFRSLADTDAEEIESVSASPAATASVSTATPVASVKATATGTPRVSATAKATAPQPTATKATMAKAAASPTPHAPATVVATPTPPRQPTGTPVTD